MAEQTPEEKYIQAISKRTKILKNGMCRYVSKVCEVLKLLQKKCKERESGSLPDALKNSLREHFRDIFWSLKLHLLFHGAPDADLKKMGVWELVSLSADEMKTKPDEKSVIDPGSKILEIVSDITQREGVPKGSTEHAQEVKEQARSLLSSLPKVFRPKVLAKVSHNGESFVGASIAVSDFLRPLYLHKRIADFRKPSLREAIIFHQPLETADTQDWSSEASKIYGTHTPSDTTKPACGNCRRTFRNLEGFVRENEQGDDNNTTILGACAEYCPVNKLLHDETNDGSEIGPRLHMNLGRCLELFQKFDAIGKQCQEADSSENKRIQKKVYKQVHPILDIFGRSPEFNNKF